MRETTEALLRRAADELARLCAGRGRKTLHGLAGKSWTMSVPVRDDDSDMVFTAVLERCAELDKRGQELRRAAGAAFDALDVYGYSDGTAKGARNILGPALTTYDQAAISEPVAAANRNESTTPREQAREAFTRS